MSKTKLRRVFSWKLRTMLLFVTATATLMMWWSRGLERRRVVSFFHDFDATAVFAFEPQPVSLISEPIVDRVTVVPSERTQITVGPYGRRKGPDWFNDHLGHEFFNKVTHVSTWKGADKISRLPQLKSVELIGPSISESDLASISRLGLSQLALRGTTCAGIDHLGSLGRLEKLDLATARFDTKAAEQWPIMPKLRELGLAYADLLDDHSLSFLRMTPSLVALDLSGLTLSATDFDLIGELSQLEVLSLSGAAFQSSNLLKFESLTNLRVLELTTTDIIDFKFADLANCRAVESLAVDVYGELTASDLASLHTFAELRSLFLDHVSFSNDSIPKLFSLAKLDSLLLPVSNAYFYGRARLPLVHQLNELENRGVRIDVGGLAPSAILTFDSRPILSEPGVSLIKNGSYRRYNDSGRGFSNNPPP